MTRARATALGFAAVLLWSALALLTVRTAPAPPFLLAALTFGIAGAGGLAWCAATGRLAEPRATPLPVHLFGIAGLWGYHALYFSALRLAPPAQASLVAYLWPLLIVLAAGALERARWPAVLGAAVAFGGAALAVAPGAGGAGSAGGLALAGLAAVTWAGYSLGSRRLGRWPSSGVAVSCAGTAALSAGAHLAWEAPAWPAGAGGWAAVAALGLGPVGVAFVLWDVGVKRGDLAALGAASYAAPVLSTVLLVLAGEAEGGPRLLLAALLVAGGAALAALSGASGGRSPP